jgi:colanic acid biosynthesis glycosyl transferase WcaI
VTGSRRSDRLRLLLLNQFYPPDVAPTGRHLHEVARRLADRGHLVTVLCSRGSYEGGTRHPPQGSLEGVRVRRIASSRFGREGVGRAAGLASFLLAAAGHAIVERQRYDLVLCLTTPPFVGWVVPRALGKRGGTVAQWVMDLYPDVLVAHGVVPAGGVLDRLLRGVTRSQLRGSALVLTLGERMQEKVRAHAGPGTRLDCVPLWSAFLDDAPPEAAVSSCREKRGWAPGRLALLYSGNMGLGHRLEEFLEGAARMADPEVVWAFAGGGRRRGEVERFAAARPAARVQLWPYAKQEDLAASLAAADVHLVSLRSPWQGLIVPSKLQAAFGVGRPAIFVGPRDCEPADWIAASGGGWHVGEGDVEALLRAVDEARDPAERRRRGEAGRAFARVRFDPATNTNRIADLLEEVAQSRRHGPQLSKEDRFSCHRPS